LIIGAKSDKDLIEKFSPLSNHDLSAGSLINIMKDRIAPFSWNRQIFNWSYSRTRGESKIWKKSNI